MKETSLDLIINNWMTTLFAYQPEIYFQLDSFRRSLRNDFVPPAELHAKLIDTGLLQVCSDDENPSKLHIFLDEHVFKAAKGLKWAVILSKDGEELEISCVDDDDTAASIQSLKPASLH